MASESQSLSMSLVLVEKPSNGIIPYNSGRIVDRVLSSVGEFIGRSVNRVAMKRGWGPTEATKRIRSILGEGTLREQMMDGIYAFSKGTREDCHKLANLRNECVILMKYTLPCESLGTQLTAFKGIVSLTTHYPYLRRLFHNLKHLNTAKDKEKAALDLWKRTDNPDDREWIFFSQMAAACISDGDVTKIVEKTPPNEMALISDKDGGVIQGLLRVINCCAHYEVSCAVGTRYLGGILELSPFWNRIGDIPHQYVAQTLLITTKHLLKDIGIECDASTESRVEKFSDIEGIDILAHAILVGVKMWLKLDPSRRLENEYWSAEFRVLLKLVILLTAHFERENARKLLPRSRNLALREYPWLIKYKRGQTNNAEILGKEPDDDQEGFDEAQVYELKSLNDEQVREIEDDNESQLPDGVKGAGSQTPTQDDIVHPRRAEQSHHDGLKHPSHKRTRITSDNLPMSSRQSIPGPPAAYSKAILEQNQATTPLTPEELTAPSQEATIDEQPKPNTQIIEELSLGSPEQHEEASDDVHPIVSIGGSSANRLDFPLSHPNSSQSTAKLNSIDTKSTPATTLGSPNPLPAVMSTSFQFQSQLQQLSVPPPQGESDFLPVSNQPLSTLRNSSSSSLLSELSGAPSPTEATFSELANAVSSNITTSAAERAQPRSKNRGRFPCPVPGCPAVSDDLFAMDGHKWGHLPQRLLPTCRGHLPSGEPCTVKYQGRISTMKRHWNTHHTIEGPWVSEPYPPFEDLWNLIQDGEIFLTPLSRYAYDPPLPEDNVEPGYVEPQSVETHRAEISQDYLLAEVQEFWRGVAVHAGEGVSATGAGASGSGDKVQQNGEDTEEHMTVDKMGGLEMTPSEEEEEESKATRKIKAGKRQKAQ